MILVILCITLALIDVLQWLCYNYGHYCIVVPHVGSDKTEMEVMPIQIIPPASAEPGVKRR